MPTVNFPSCKYLPTHTEGEVQTCSEATGLRQWNTLEAAINYAIHDSTVWKISYTHEGSHEHIVIRDIVLKRIEPTTPVQSFTPALRRFNRMYGLPSYHTPVLPSNIASRLDEFKKILQDEVNEVDDIIDKIHAMKAANILGKIHGTGDADILADLADWLMDICIYSMSEMLRMGLTPEEAFAIIMQSNETKLGAAGKPIIKDGKVQKGPNFVPPEPELKRWILASMYQLPRA